MLVIRIKINKNIHGYIHGYPYPRQPWEAGRCVMYPATTSSLLRERERERERDAECLDARSQGIPCYRSPLIWQISAAAASSPIYYRTTWAAGSFRRVWQLSCAADSIPAAGAIRRSPDVAWDWEWRHRTVGELRTHRSAFVILLIEWLKFCV